MLKRIIFLSAGLLLSATSALAMTPSENSLVQKKGIYGDVNLGWGKVGPIDQETKSTGFSGSLNFGYLFNPYIGVEIGFAQYPDYTSSIDEDVKLTGNRAVDIAAKGVFPITNRMTLFMKLGIAQAYTSFNVDTILTTRSNNQIGDTVFSQGMHHGIALFIAMGTSVAITKNVSFIAQFYGNGRTQNRLPNRFALTAGVGANV